MKNLSRKLPILFIFFSACGVELRKDEVNSIALERVHARVIRFNCNQEAVSDRTEEVQEPSKWLRIKAESSSKRVDSADIKNLSLRPESNTGVISIHPDGASFLAHYSNTFVGFQVSKGLNEFSYLFKNQIQAGEYEEIESGTLLVDVTYSERFDPEIREIYMSAEECAEDDAGEDP